MKKNYLMRLDKLKCEKKGLISCKIKLKRKRASKTCLLSSLNILYRHKRSIRTYYYRI